MAAFAAVQSFLKSPPSGATRQSFAENAISRLKALVGTKLTAHGFAAQQVEVLVKCQVLNRMVSLGWPVSERVPAT